MSILAHATFVSQKRRDARRSVRQIARNIKTAAAQQGVTSPLAMRRQTGIPLRRVVLMWAGVNMNMRELTTYMHAYDLTVTELFAGSQDLIR